MSIWSFVGRFSIWVKGRPDIVAAALVGSHARGSATRDSDVDLVILCEVPDELLAGDWPNTFGELDSRSVEDYGALRSLRVNYRNGMEVEFGIGSPSWAELPLNAGTRAVLADGALILHDPRGMLHTARAAAISRGAAGPIE